MICACLLLGCGTTPIDAVVADPDANTPTFPSQSDACSVPAAGRFTLSLEGGCLQRGDATTVFMSPAFDTELTTECNLPRAQWDLTPAEAGSFTLLNAEVELALDVRAASSTPGTSVLIFDPTGLDNQRFWLRLRAGGGYALQARHAPELCVDARGTEIEVWPCDTSSAYQAFHFARVGCP